MRRPLYSRSQGFNWKARLPGHGEKEMRWWWTLMATLLSLAKHMGRRSEVRPSRTNHWANRELML
jgi:hypothetical protein